MITSLYEFAVKLEETLKHKPIYYSLNTKNILFDICDIDKFRYNFNIIYPRFLFISIEYIDKINYKIYIKCSDVDVNFIFDGTDGFISSILGYIIEIPKVKCYIRHNKINEIKTIINGF